MTALLGERRGVASFSKTICMLNYFQFRFLGHDFGSVCYSSWALYYTYCLPLSVRGGYWLQFVVMVFPGLYYYY